MKKNVDKKRMIKTERERLPRTFVEIPVEGGYVGVRKAVRLDFACVADMIAARDASPCRAHGYNEEMSSRRDDWSRDWSDMRADFVECRGDAAIAKQIEELTTSLAANASTTSAWTMAPAGAYPIVPIALGGDPDSMRQRIQTTSQGAPLRVYVPLTCSAGIGNKQYARLLAQVIAALRCLSERRPVELIAYAGLNLNEFEGELLAPRHSGQTGAIFMTVPIEFQYGDFSKLAVWCDTAIGRTVCMAIAHTAGEGYYGQWPWALFPESMGIHELTKQALGAGEHDLVIPSACSSGDIDRAITNIMNILKAEGIEIDLNSSRGEGRHG